MAMRNDLPIAAKTKFWALFFTMFGLVACGGSSETTPVSSTEVAVEETPIETTTTSDTSEQAATPAPTVAVNTAVADNPSDSPVDLKLYESFALNIPVGDYDFSGTKKFAKVTNFENQILFLGQLPNISAVQLPLSVEINAFPVTVELFTESSSDTSVYFEVDHDEI